MAVFEYRGILVATGKRSRACATPRTPRPARRPAQGRHPAHERHRGEPRRSRRRQADIELFALLRNPLGGRHRHDDAAARHAGARRHPAGRVAVRAHRAGREGSDCERVLTKVRDRFAKAQLRQGARAAPEIFPPLYVNMVARRRGLGHARRQCSSGSPTSWRGRRSCSGKVAAALAYPILMLVIGDDAHRRDDGRGRAEGDQHLREHGPRAALVHAAAHRACRVSPPATGG